MKRYILVILGLALLFSSPIHAAEINDAGAKRLETLTSKLIDRQKTAIELSGGSLKTDGDITVEQADSYYAVTLPAMVFHDADGMQSKIGLIAINAIPTSNPDNWKVSIAIPTPILYSDKEDTPIMRLDIGSQRMGGLWNGKLENFAKLAARYNNLKLSRYKRQEFLSIEQFDLTTDLKETKEDNWSGPTKINLSNLNFGTKKSPQILSLKEAKIHLAVDGFSPLAQKETISRLSEDQNKTNLPDSDVNTNLIMNLFQNAGNTTTMMGVVNGFKMNSPIIPGKFSLDSGSFAFNMSGMKEGLVNQSLQIGYRGLINAQSQHHYSDLLPSELNINIALNKLPLKDILAIGGKALNTQSESAGPNQVALLQAMMTLPQTLSKAGTTLTLTDTTYGNRIYNVDMNGALKTNSNSILGATGELLVKIQGLKRMISALQKRAQTSPPHIQNQINSGIRRLELMDKISKEENGVKTCKFTLTEQAKILANGKEINGLLTSTSQ